MIRDNVHVLKTIMVANKIKLYAVSKATGIRESLLSRLLNKIDPMSEKQEDLISTKIFELLEKKVELFKFFGYEPNCIKTHKEN